MKRIILCSGWFFDHLLCEHRAPNLQEKYDILTNEVDQLRQQSEKGRRRIPSLTQIGEVRRTVNILVEDTMASFERMQPTNEVRSLSKQYDYLPDNNSTPLLRVLVKTRR